MSIYGEVLVGCNLQFINNVNTFTFTLQLIYKFPCLF